MSWDITVPDTFTESHLSFIATEQGVAAKQTADNKTAKYQELEKTHIFFPAATETAGSRSQQDIELLQDIGRRISAITEDNRETIFLFQRLTVALQRGNVISFLSTVFPQDSSAVAAISYSKYTHIHTYSVQ